VLTKFRCALRSVHVDTLFKSSDIDCRAQACIDAVPPYPRDLSKYGGCAPIAPVAPQALSSPPAQSDEETEERGGDGTIADASGPENVGERKRKSARTEKPPSASQKSASQKKKMNAASLASMRPFV
jgi:hypothetical protein